MELRVLRYFLETAREGSVTRAAIKLHISQPTLSKQIKDLEQELGKKLFVRGNYSIRLTEEGMLLRKRAEDILDMVEKTADEFRSLDEVTGGDIHIGCAESDGVSVLARCAKELRERYPSLRFHLYSGNTDDLAERLDRGLLDLAIVVESVDLKKYNSMELPITDTFGVMMRKDSPLAAKEAVSPKDLQDLPLICSRQSLGSSYLKWFGEKAGELNISVTFNLSYNADIMAKEGLGYVVSFQKNLIDTGPDSPLCFRPLTPPLESKTYVIWKKYQVFSKPAQQLLERLQKLNWT